MSERLHIVESGTHVLKNEQQKSREEIKVDIETFGVDAFLAIVHKTYHRHKDAGLNAWALSEHIIEAMVPVIETMNSYDISGNKDEILRQKTIESTQTDRSRLQVVLCLCETLDGPYTLVVDERIVPAE